MSHFTSKKQSNQGGFNLGGINATGQIPALPGNFGLIDKDTPKEAYTLSSFVDTEELVLVFSDEFNQDGRTFYPGDDPFWEAVDLHYWVTVSDQISVYLAKLKIHLKNDLEWYDPQQGARSMCCPLKSPLLRLGLLATTAGGNLRLKLDLMNNTADNHNMSYRSGMVSHCIFCFLNSFSRKISDSNMVNLSISASVPI
jgi:hypothetical protein